jgi:hypothetical protein
VLLVTFTICWVVVCIIKGLEPLGWESPLKKGGRPIWWSGFYGDIFLPVGVTSSIVTIRHLDGFQTWYTSLWWNWLGILLGFVIIILLEARGNYTRKQLLTTSKIWHTLVSFPLMFYLTFMSIVPLIVAHQPIQSIIFAIIGYGAWGLTLIHDILKPPNYSKTH